jgi:hypothetical protein
MASVNRISREAAEALAVQALAYLAGDPEHLGRFLALSGLGPDTIRAAAGDRSFLAGVIEYVTSDESLLIAFTEHAQVSPAQVVDACAVLAGKPWERDTA